MADGKPTLHHLNDSQSQRILWLLEELKIPYNLVLHHRKKGRAPAELFETHPLGKSPLLVTADGRVIIESSAIAKYLIATYDGSWQFVGNSNTGNDDIRDETLSSFANASLMPMALISMVFDMLVQQSPFFVRPLFSLLYGTVNKVFLKGEIHKLLQWLSSDLKGQEYFMGERPGRADFMLSWPVDFMTQRGYVTLTDYPELEKWHESCKARPAWKESLNKGNGYDLASPPK